MLSEGALSEEKAQCEKIDAAHLADELCNEQDMTQSLEREKKLIEAQAKDMQVRREERRP